MCCKAGLVSAIGSTFVVCVIVGACSDMFIPMAKKSPVAFSYGVYIVAGVFYAGPALCLLWHVVRSLFLNRFRPCDLTPKATINNVENIAMKANSKKWVVLVDVKNFYMANDGNIGNDRLGFFATRCIEAQNSQEAEKTAVSFVKQEYSKLCANAVDNPPVIYVQEVKEVKDFGKCLVPGRGGSFYPDPA